MAPKTSEKKVYQRYQKQTLHESILARPDTFVGSDKKVQEEMFIYDDKKDMIVKKEISIVPALLKIFDEAIVNAADQITRTKDNKKGEKVTYIKVNINKEEGSIEVINDGPGIPVVMHPEYNMYVPELIFGNLLTSSNYDTTEDKYTGGKNGVGIKLAAIFSTKFIAETVDSKEKKKFHMVMENNMYTKNKPKITKYSKKSYTSVKFFPDFKRFDLTGFTDDIYAVLKRRVYDISACTATAHSIKVYFNDNLIKINKFEDYIKLHFDEKRDIVFEQLDDKWEVGVALSEEVFEQVSFVNYINTYKGGRHVNYVADKIVAETRKLFEKKYKGKKVKSSFIKNRLFVFVNSLIKNPSFESQSKELLSTPVKDFGSSIEISDSFMRKVKKLGLLEEVNDMVSLKEKKEAAKTDGKKTKRVKINKLDDALKAGTDESHKCRLILTEGDSAKTFAINGLKIIGNKYYGVFPLKGKLINARVQAQSKVNKNEELNNLKEIIGLTHGKKYTDTKSLRYGGIVILTDQDVDGSHIKGLIMNWLHYEWPELLELGFVFSLITPIVKVFKKVGKKTESKSFYTLSDFEKWKKGPSDGFKNPKYYKGLGTSNETEQKEAFIGFDEKIVSYIYDDEANTKIMEAFDKDMANTRKEWLLNYDPDDIIKQTQTKVPISDFITKDLVHFSQYDIIRSIPSLIDGLKPSQRKILHSVIKRQKVNKNELKVSQLAGYVSAETDYHHGEASLISTIVKMAQNYPSSNNINMLTPSGNFGSRLKGGDDASSARYIFTNIEAITNKIFMNEDNKILDYQTVDNLKIEPEWFMPIVPMVLVNGAKGIGTGFSTEILSYKLEDIVQQLMNLMSNKDVEEMTPYYRGWDGKIETIETKEDGTKTYTFDGEYTLDDNDNTITITELPLYTWTENYKAFLNDMEMTRKDAEKAKAKVYIKKYDYTTSTNYINFKLYFDKLMYTKVKKDPVKYLKLQKKLGTGNMYLFNEDNIITKYDTVEDILREFYALRIKFYKKRKENMISEKESQVQDLNMKYRFVFDVIEDKIKVFKKTKADIEKQLTDKKYIKKEGTFDYLTKIPIVNFSKDYAEKLKADYEKAVSELEELKKMNIKTVWKNELKDLLRINEEVNKELIEMREAEETKGKKKKVGKKK